MTCRKCNAEMTKADVSVEIADHDDTVLDVIITCPKCGHRINDFVDTKSAIDID